MKPWQQRKKFTGNFITYGQKNSLSVNVTYNTQLCRIYLVLEQYHTVVAMT